MILGKGAEQTDGHGQARILRRHAARIEVEECGRKPNECCFPAFHSGAFLRAWRVRWVSRASCGLMAARPSSLL